MKPRRGDGRRDAVRAVTTRSTIAPRRAPGNPRAATGGRDAPARQRRAAARSASTSHERPRAATARSTSARTAPRAPSGKAAVLLARQAAARLDDTPVLLERRPAHLAARLLDADLPEPGVREQLGELVRLAERAQPAQELPGARRAPAERLEHGAVGRGLGAPEGGERHAAARADHAVELGERRRRTVQEDEDEVAGGGVEAPVAARERLGGAPDEGHAEGRDPRAGLPEHRRRHVEADDADGRAGRRRGRRRDQPRPRAHVEEPVPAAERARGEEVRDERRQDARHRPVVAQGDGVERGRGAGGARRRTGLRAPGLAAGGRHFTAPAVRPET